MLLLSKGQVHRAADTLVATSPGASGTCFHSAASCPWGSAGEGGSSARLQQPSAEPCGVHRASWVCAIAAVLEEVNELETAVSFTAPSLWGLPPHHQQRRHFNEPVGAGLHLYCSWDCKHTKAMFTLFFSPLKCFFFFMDPKNTLQQPCLA